MAKENSVQNQHKPGPLKQQNKSHKHGRHKTKGMLDNINKGRVNIRVKLKKSNKNIGKLDRRNQAKQQRANKREAILQQKRKIGKFESPPHSVCLVPLSASCNTDEVFQNMCRSNEDITVVTTSKCRILSCPHMKQWYSFYVPKYGDLYGILDAAKAADVVVFLMVASGFPDSFGEKCMSCVVAQGIPTCFHVVQAKSPSLLRCLKFSGPKRYLSLSGIREFPAKRQNNIKKDFNKLVEQRFPKDRVHTLDTPEFLAVTAALVSLVVSGILSNVIAASKMEASQLLRLIANHHHKTVVYKDTRPHLLAHEARYESTDDEKECGTLKVSGFVKGRALSANNLIHIPGFGNFQLSQIDSCHNPCPGKKVRKKESAMDIVNDDNSGAMDEDIKVLHKADPAFQETLVGEVTPDPMEGEQTWPTEEELNEADMMQQGRVTKRVPKGTSSYQSAWILEEDEDDCGSDQVSLDDIGEDELMKEIKEDSGESVDGEEYDGQEDYETISVTTDTQESRYDEKYPDDDRTEIKKARAERENEMFPDEIDTPFDVPARVRFQKYRGLKSFRTSPWDPKENLPSDYARIFQFENFDRTKRRVMKAEDDEGALPGWYVTVYVKDVPKIVADNFVGMKPLVIFGVLPHEQKMSVVHFVIKRHPSCMDTIQAKDPLVFQCGYKRFSASPVFSQHSTGNKFKMERFLPKEGVVVATVYASITFPPCPALVFKADSKSGIHKLVATGSLYQINPNRIVAKKIVVSGFPFKINKKSAVVRHMFYSREDILWFKPVELWTKYGRRGHIKEPLGTHGHMKCVFDGPIKAQDTVCMNLYKRIFPKWTYDERLNPCPLEEADDEQMAVEDN